MKLNTRIENCLKDYEKIDNETRQRYVLKFSDLQVIIGMVYNNPETNFNSIFEIISMCYKIGFVLGRRSKK